MKVVLFCGGMGTRMWDHERAVPKPMVEIGYRPLLWNLMRYYAHFGHKDFILCLGYKADVIKRYFLGYNEGISNDFVMTNGRDIELLSSDIEDWRITFADTGISSEVGERLMKVRQHLDPDEPFLVNYSDGLSDVHLPDLIELHKTSDAVLTMLMSKPTSSFHTVSYDGIHITDVEDITTSDVWINAGFFVADHRIFDYLEPGEDLIPDALPKLIKDRAITGYRYHGFWTAMDTFKDLQRLQELHKNAPAPWEVWKQGPDT